MGWKKILIFIGLLFIVGFNFYLYKAEFKVLVDPNDNIFQYALIDEARNIWKQVFAGKLSPFYLLDSWQERWAEGFALSSYYAHLPQGVISLIGLISPIGEYKMFVFIRTIMLILMPVMFYLGARILGVSLLPSLLVSLFSQAIFTDGLYGIDVTSYMWRGWGLSAQLMAVFFLPVAFAYTINYFDPPSHEATAGKERNLGKAIFFNFLVASSHFGIFSLALLGYPLYWFVSVIPNLFRFNFSHSGLAGIVVIFKQRFWSRPAIGGTPQNDSKGRFIRTAKFISLTLFSLSYFIIPFFTQGQYRNYSVWDPVWKFDSWGIKQIVIWFLNGDLFDFGRLPIITYAVIFGLSAGLIKGSKLIRYFCLLFIFYFILFLGRATFGGVMNLIPGFSEFHQHRIIVLVQFAGIFIAGNFLYKLSRDLHGFLTDYHGLRNQRKSVSHPWSLWLIAGLLIIFIPIIIYLEGPVIKYAKDNNVWIERANQAYLKDLPDYEKIKNKLATLPKARVYVGRPGNWGKDFTVGETPLYMVLSRDGYSTIGFLPQSWSPNSDPEQFFNENDINFYNLYNVGYSILPENVKVPEFAKLITKEGKYLLYEIKTTGWFVAGVSNIAVKSKKTDLLNPTRIWFESELFKNSDYPKIDLTKAVPDGKKWYIEMTDKNNWINLNDGKERNLWQVNPFSVDGDVFRRSTKNITLITNQKKLINGYSVKVQVKEECNNCLVVLKQSFHPNWQVKLNGEKVKAFPVFPFYIGIPVEKVGDYELTVEYKPNNIKVILVWIELLVGIYLVFKFLQLNR